MINTILHGDCLEVMPRLPDKSVDMILCDLPYAVTQNAWDSIVPLDQLWAQYKRVIKDNGVIVLTAQGLFTAALILSKPEWYRYTLVWQKNNITGHLNAKKQPLRKHEDILVFYKNQPTYNPQMTNGTPYQYSHYQYDTNSSNYGDQKGIGQVKNEGERYPTSIVSVEKVSPKKEKIVHPTQKPVALFEYLIKTYTNPGELVLDNCAGSCTTAVAALSTGRQFICIEKELKYVEIGKQRIANIQTALPV
jgi:site-specific DNA-methyltransferase (adenine-specific)